MTNGWCERPIARPAIMIVSLIGSSSFFNTYQIAMAAQVEKCGKALRVRYPQQVELLGDRARRIEPGILGRATAIIARRPVILRHGLSRSNDLERMVHQFELYGEQSFVDLVAQLVPFEHQVPLRPDGAGINRILRLDQGHHDAILSLEYLPYVRGPA